MNLQDLSDINLQNIDIVKQKLAIQENLLLQKAFSGNDVDAIMKAQQFVAKKQSSNVEPKSYIFDPQAVMDSMGYKDKPIALTYSVLRYMARTPIIRSIIGTRIDQIAAFSQPTDDEQKQGWTIRKKKRLFQKDSDKVTDQDKRRCEELALFIINGGIEQNKWGRDDFEKWLRKTSYDSLVLDQEAWEIPRNRKNDIVEFFATDGGTYRLAVSYDDEEYRRRFQEEARKAEEVNGFFPSYVQVYNSQVMAEFYPWELCLGMRNQTTSILNNGYSICELEDLITIITSMLYSDQYNAKIFTNGAMPKGIIRASGNISQPKLMEFRQQWQTQVAGVSNAHKTPILEADKMDWVDLQKCLHEDTEVITKSGRKTLGQLLNNKIKTDEVLDEIWDGIKFTKARIYKTKKRKIYSLTLNNRLDIKTSPEHKFLILRDNFPVWIERKNIVLGDYVFVNKKNINTNIKRIKYNGIDVDSDLFELLGWITGDGCIGKNENSKRLIRTFYHPEKELDIVEKHIITCKKYKINVKKNIQTISKIEEQKLKDKGVKNIINKYPLLVICDINFYNWILNLGFTPSNLGKTIPDFLYSFNSVYKCSFLKGFFSADGHISINGIRVDITISNPILKWQTRMLLMTEGIRCTKYKSKKSNYGFSVNSEDTVLLIKDRDLFFEKIGFVQEYKQNREKVRQKSIYKINEAPIEFIKNLALEVKIFNKTKSIKEKLNKKDLHDLLNISKGYQKASLSKVLHYANKINFNVPSFLIDYNLEQVIELSQSDEETEMVDVEMYNESHQFCANGMIVHNSNRDMEFSKWQEYLIRVACAVYKIAPQEVIDLQNTSSHLFEGNQKSKTDYSKEKGLTPILRFKQNNINKYLISEIDPNYEFVFTGVTPEDEKEVLDADIKKVMNIETVNEVRKRRGLKELESGDLILNGIWMQQLSMQMYGSQQSNDSVEQQEDIQQSVDNPMMKDLQDFINKELVQEKITF